jgi:hypothetical protein
LKSRQCRHIACTGLAWTSETNHCFVLSISETLAVVSNEPRPETLEQGEGCMGSYSGNVRYTPSQLPVHPLIDAKWLLMGHSGGTVTHSRTTEVDDHGQICIVDPQAVSVHSSPTFNHTNGFGPATKLHCISLSS